MRIERRLDRREAAQDGGRERRVNRVERRLDRRDGLSERPRGEMREIQRQERSGPRRGGERMERGQRGRD
jgi:hypothetical protein